MNFESVGGEIAYKNERRKGQKLTFQKRLSLCQLLLATATQIKNEVQTNEVTDFCIENILSKRSDRFHEHTLAESERLMPSKFFIAKI